MDQQQPELSEKVPQLLNREIGILKFNERVLAMAEDASVPLLERLKYVCIVSSNLDEFFEIRVAGLKAQARTDPSFVLEDGKTVVETMRNVSELAHAIVARQYAIYNDVLVPALEAEGIVFHVTATWNEAHARFARDYFEREVLPILTPIAIDPARPFPRVLNKSLNFAIELSGRDAFGRNSGIAIVQAPRALPRLIQVPREISGYPHGLMLLTSVMQGCVGSLFPGMEIKGIYQFRCTRNSDLFIDDEEVTNLREALKGELSQRQFGDAVRLELSDNCSASMREYLCKQFSLGSEQVFPVGGPVNLVRLMQVPDLIDRPELKYRPFVPGLPEAIRKGEAKQRDLFKIIAKQDVLVHHPYQSFTPVLDFVRQAVNDPNVVAIKQTIYRTGNQSELMELLVQAARMGKEVTVVLELLARFDEETNINWAARLEEAGAHVVFGVVGHKTHAKLLFVVRREIGRTGATKLVRYAHLGTGNYHPRTAKLYTDFGLFTSDAQLCQDVHELFQQLTGLGRHQSLKQIWQAPFTLHENVCAGIRTEIANVKAGGKGRIIARINALLEDKVIALLYEASQAGVQVDLIVRGVCALRPGVPGLSENIVVRSVIGRFLEHSRAFYFFDNGAERVYLSSADWMDRNFFRRIEVAFPVTDKKLKARVIEEGLMVLLDDNALAWIMDSEGNYTRLAPAAGEPRRSTHGVLLHQLAQITPQPKA
ncbi:polyphosphate kinase 1 [Derxia lacustris]|uniref:polyphosphate kinase 1 n=1 Tax=Derxia lacustris TaxID=764842 RepID=UPI000A16EA57|nr:polyphosphate kinase 1 [Derxia lacustris]